jgi:hypothetical protein
MEDKPLVNKVALSGLVTLNLEDFFPKQEIMEFDLKPHLFMELILKEKDFRLTVSEYDWSQYQGKNLLVFCSADAIIPTWAYMLVASAAAPYANTIFQGDQTSFLSAHYKNLSELMDLEPYKGKRIVLKGCSDKPVPPEAYVAFTTKLHPIAQSIMFGEPCSTVPIFKAKKEQVN